MRGCSNPISEDERGDENSLDFKNLAQEILWTSFNLGRSERYSFPVRSAHPLGIGYVLQPPLLVPNRRGLELQ